MTTVNGPIRLRSDSVAWNPVGEVIVALDLTSSAYFSTNATGTLLWKLLASGTSRSELVNTLVVRFGVNQETIEQDVDVFLADLERARLLEIQS
jgi:Coenzyme PQQ synthesis protein D (PqqD)